MNNQEFQNQKHLLSLDRCYLKPGDCVDVVAPASKCHPSVLEKMKGLLASWNLQCQIPSDLFGDSLLCANSDKMRFYHLEHALLNNDSKAVWCLLGGYGSTKLIPFLSQIQPPTHSKIFIGFSDITALHIFLQEKWGWSTIHGPSGYQVSLNKISTDSVNLLKKMLFQQTGESFIYDQIVPLNQFAQNQIIVDAPLIGGNLHLIQASLGTSWQINPSNKILFIEEINERAYRIDRVLAHLNQAEVFKHVKAILFGDFIDKGEPDGRFLVSETLKEFADQCPLPVLQISHIGHGFHNNPIFLGRNAKLTMGEKSSLEFFF